MVAIDNGYGEQPVDVDDVLPDMENFFNMTVLRSQEQENEDRK